MSWTLPESKIRAVTEFSPYEPPDCIGAAWWLKLGSRVSEFTDNAAYESVVYEDAYRLDRKSIVEGLPCGGGAVAIDEEGRTFSVKTGRTCGAFALKGVVKAGVLTVDFGESEGAVWASSLDDKPLADTDRILVTHLTDVKSTGMTFGNVERTILLDWGRSPALVRVAEAKVVLDVAMGKWRIYRLNSSGRRLGEVTGMICGGKLVFTASSAPCDGDVSMCYEIKRYTKE